MIRGGSRVSHSAILPDFYRHINQFKKLEIRVCNKIFFFCIMHQENDRTSLEQGFSIEEEHSKRCYEYTGESI